MASGGQAMQAAAGFSAAAYVRSAFEILAEGAPAVAQSLVKLATEGKSEYVRVQAAQAVLSRIGLAEKVDVGITAVHLVGGVDEVVTGPSAAEVLQMRLSDLRRAALEAGSIVDGEIVEGESEEGALANVLQLFPEPDTDEEQ